MSRPDQLSRTWGIPWKNTAASDCPPFGVIESTGVVTEGLLQGTRPTGSTTASYYFNGENTVPAGKSGFATQDSPHPAAYDTADGTPAALAEWGPQSGTWLLKNAGTGFTVEGGHGDGVVAVSRKAYDSSTATADVKLCVVTGIVLSRLADFDGIPHPNPGPLYKCKTISQTSIAQGVPVGNINPVTGAYSSNVSYTDFDAYLYSAPPNNLGEIADANLEPNDLPARIVTGSADLAYQGFYYATNVGTLTVDSVTKPVYVHFPAIYPSRYISNGFAPDITMNAVLQIDYLSHVSYSGGVMTFYRTTDHIRFARCAGSGNYQRMGRTKYYEVALELAVTGTVPPPPPPPIPDPPAPTPKMPEEVDLPEFPYPGEDIDEP